MTKRELIALLSEWDDNTEVVYRAFDGETESIVEYEILDVVLSWQNNDNKIVLCVDREMVDLL